MVFAVPGVNTCEQQILWGSHGIWRGSEIMVMVMRRTRGWDGIMFPNKHQSRGWRDGFDIMKRLVAGYSLPILPGFLFICKLWILEKLGVGFY